MLFSIVFILKNGDISKGQILSCCLKMSVLLIFGNFNLKFLSSFFQLLLLESGTIFGEWLIISIFLRDKIMCYVKTFQS